MRAFCLWCSGRYVARSVVVLLFLVGLSACSGFASSGPSTAEMTSAAKSPGPNQLRFSLLNVDQTMIPIMEKWRATSLEGRFGDRRPPPGQTIGMGDSIQIVIWEAAAGGLFSAPVNDRMGSGSRSAQIPEQLVGRDGAVTVPYAGRVSVAGRSPQQVEVAIVSALQGKAIDPQALVTITKNTSNTITVIGEVTAGARVPLNLRGDRVLDVIAAAGGIRVAPHEVFLTLTRGVQSVRIPMQAVLNDPRENIFVMPGDVLTVAREQQTFTAAGATGKNAVVPFDTIGVTLEEAIAKAGGLNDQRSDAEGVFVIRFEPVQQYDQLGKVRPSPDLMDEVPTIYRLNMREPGAFFIARKFPMRNKDILYVSNSPGAELQKVLTIIQSVLLPATGVFAVSAVTR